MYYMEQLPNINAIREVEFPLIDEAFIEALAGKIVAAFSPRRVILFGSRARGDYRPESDVDLFIEMDTNEPRWKRRWQVDDLFPRRWWPMDLYIMNPAEVRQSLLSSMSILPDIEREGKVLYDELHHSSRS